VYEVRGGSVNDTGMCGFVCNLVSGGDPLAGSKSVSLVTVRGTNLGDSKDTVFDAVRALSDADRNPSQVVLCFDEGENSERLGAIIVGGQSGAGIATEVIVNVQGESDPSRGSECSA
jgi:hypothetical protein